MKTKHLLLGMCVLLAGAGAWAGRVAWRAHKQLVTLDVREAPLAEVLRKIERQTWTKLRAEKALDDARITLRVTDKPLLQVLNRIAEQASAHCSSVYAVYGSSSALNALDSALRRDGKLEPAGWTTLVPRAPASAPDGSDGPQIDAPPMMNPETSNQEPQKRGIMLFRRGPDGPVVFQGGNGHVEVWSPQQLVAEATLAAKIDTNETWSATADAAAELARKVNGRWTTYLAFSKSSTGFGFGIPPKNRAGPNPPLRRPDPNDRFANLTPEQRVQRARQRLGFNVDSNQPNP